MYVFGCYLPPKKTTTSDVFIWLQWVFVASVWNPLCLCTALQLGPVGLIVVALLKKSFLLKAQYQCQDQTRPVCPWSRSEKDGNKVKYVARNMSSHPIISGQPLEITWDVSCLAAGGSIRRRDWPCESHMSVSVSSIWPI